MTQARAALVTLSQAPYYHVISKCVRRAWLCGNDVHSGKDYSHRKSWMHERLALHAEVFAINVCAYAFMHNHYHLVLHVDRARAQELNAEEVVERWTRLFKLPELLERWQRGVCNRAEQERAERLINDWRERLADVSWFMRCLNEHLARRANSEDQCTGRFWEGRFRLQALLDEVGLLTAMTFVDLNPARIDALGTSLLSTSLCQRIEQTNCSGSEAQPAEEGQPVEEGMPVPLQGMASNCPASSEPEVIPFCLPEYLELVRWTRTQLRAAHIEEAGDLPNILQRLSIERREWTMVMRGSSAALGRAMGRRSQLRRCAAALGQSWIRGVRRAQRLYNG
jgi:putative transposase